MTDNFDEFADNEYIVVVPSKGRPNLVKNANALFPYQSCIYINSNEYESYSKMNPKAKIVCHNVNGYGRVINSLLDKISKYKKLKYVFIYDDDITFLNSMVGNNPRKMDLHSRYKILENALQIMEDSDSYMYLFSTSSSIVKYVQSKPFTYGIHLPQGAYILNAKIKCRYEDDMSYYEDFDFVLQVWKRYRAMICEQRFILSGGLVDHEIYGGCNSNRTSQNEEYSRNKLLKKWGDKVVGFTRNSRGNIRPAVKLKTK